MPADQVKQREQIDPDDVDKVPVQAEIFNKGYVARGIRAGLCAEDHESQNGDADDHVQGVHARHRKIEEKVELGVSRHIGLQRRVVVLLVDLGVALRIQE